MELNLLLTTSHHFFILMAYIISSHTFQQNGVVEMKHRHLLDINRCLRIQSHISHSLEWMQNAYKLLLILLTCPFFLLYGTHLVLTHLRVVVCLCLANINYHIRKFDNRSIKVVFLGYSIQSKGYKVLDLDSLHVITQNL